MIDAFLKELDSRWRVELEVPVIQPRGVIDIVLTDRRDSTILAAEAQSELRSIEQQLRWAAEKSDGLARRREGGTEPAGGGVSRLLIQRSTVTTREVARRYGTTLAAAFPARTEDVVRALCGPVAPWPGPGLVWMHVEGSKASLMRFPPRGVNLGRQPSLHGATVSHHRNSEVAGAAC